MLQLSAQVTMSSLTTPSPFPKVMNAVRGKRLTAPCVGVGQVSYLLHSCRSYDACWISVESLGEWRRLELLSARRTQPCVGSPSFPDQNLKQKGLPMSQATQSAQDYFRLTVEMKGAVCVPEGHLDLVSS